MSLTFKEWLFKQTGRGDNAGIAKLAIHSCVHPIWKGHAAVSLRREMIKQGASQTFLKYLDEAEREYKAGLGFDNRPSEQGLKELARSRSIEKNLKSPVIYKKDKWGTFLVLYFVDNEGNTSGCPYCGSNHIHGTSGGHRIAHCGNLGRATVTAPDGTVLKKSDGYIIVEKQEFYELVYCQTAAHQSSQLDYLNTDPKLKSNPAYDELRNELGRM